MVAQQTRDYELVMILSPEATEEEITATVERVHGYLADRGGSVGDHEVWGLKRLAFPVQRFLDGNYTLTKFSLGPAEVAELNRTLMGAEDILRFLVTKT